MSVAPPRAIRILIVDDHAIFRTGVIALLQSQPDVIVVGEAENGVQAVALFRKLLPDIVLMDLQMPGGSGMAAISDILSVANDARILVLTTYSGDIQASNALKAGARGYLLKNTLRTELATAIRSAMAGEIPLSPEIAREIALHSDKDMLTARETAILREILEGAPNKLIARNLDITEETVKWHLKSIFAKLGASDRTDAVIKAGRRGVFDL